MEQSAGPAGGMYKLCAKCTLDDRITGMRADKMKSASEVLRVMYSGVSEVLHVSACELAFD